MKRTRPMQVAAVVEDAGGHQTVGTSGGATGVIRGNMYMKGPPVDGWTHVVEPSGAIFSYHENGPKPAEIVGNVYVGYTLAEVKDFVARRQGERAAEQFRRDAAHAQRDAEQARRDAARAERDAEQARRDAEQARRDAERARQDAAQTRVYTVAQAEQALRDAEQARRDARQARLDAAQMQHDAEQAWRDAQRARPLTSASHVLHNYFSPRPAVVDLTEPVLPPHHLDVARLLGPVAQERIFIQRVPTAAAAPVPIHYPDPPKEPEPTTEDAANQCVICMDRVRATTAIPCGCQYACVTCILEQKPTTCATCRAPLTGVYRAYRV